MTRPALVEVRKVRTPRAALDHRATRDAADRAASRVVDRFTRGLHAADNEAARLAADLARGPAAAAEAAAKRQAARLGGAADKALADGVRAGLQVGAATAPESLAAAALRVVTLPGLPEQASKWARGRAAELVVQLSADTRATLRGAITRGLAHGTHPRALARDIKPLIGLTDRMALAVERQRAGLVARGLAPENVVRRSEAYAERLLRARAENIARTETFRAVNEGRRGLWEELVRTGDVREGEVVREWLTARDERVDDICHTLDGSTATLEGDFPGGFFEPPDPHPSCLPGSAVVQAVVVQGATRRWYDGNLLVVRTAAGDRLACTPNHPIATPAGWVAASALGPQSQVMRVSGAGPGGTPIKQVVGMLDQRADVTFRIAPLTGRQFHGDTLQTDMASVWTVGEPTPWRDATLPAHAPEYGVLATVDVLAVEKVIFKGYVYNLQTAAGWFVSENVVVHNCRCTILYRRNEP